MSATDDLKYASQMASAAVTDKLNCGPEPTVPWAASVTAPKNNVEEAKPDMSLLPMDLLRDYLVPAYEEGVLKYWRESWRGGFKTSVCVASIERHLTQYHWGGEDMDPDSLVDNKHHLAAVVFWALTALHSNKTRPELDDRHGKAKTASK